MERVVPWTDPVALVSPYMPEGRRGRQRQRRGRGQQPAARAGRPIRYEHEAPGDMLHIDTKKLGRWNHRYNWNRPHQGIRLPVILTRDEDLETWLSAPWDEAKHLQCPLPDGSPSIVARRSKADHTGLETQV
jgi:hypothetical protein